MALALGDERFVDRAWSEELAGLEVEDIRRYNKNKKLIRGALCMNTVFLVQRSRLQDLAEVLGAPISQWLPPALLLEDDASFRPWNPEAGTNQATGMDADTRRTLSMYDVHPYDDADDVSDVYGVIHGLEARCY